jgi:hypothetical protein
LAAQPATIATASNMTAESALYVFRIRGESVKVSVTSN